MKEDFVTYELAVKLKEKGFKEKTFAYYYPKGSGLIYNRNQFRGGFVKDCLYSNNSLPNECMASDFVDAPTISQVLKWLREEKKIHISIMLFMFSKGWCYEIVQIVENPKLITTQRNSCNTYEEAAIAGIEYVINNLI